MKFISYNLFVLISVFLYIFFPIVLVMGKSPEKVSTVTEGNVIPQKETPTDKTVGKVEEDVKKTEDTGSKSTTESQEEPELSEPIDKTEESTVSSSSSENREIVPHHNPDGRSQSDVHRARKNLDEHLVCPKCHSHISTYGDSSDSSLANIWPLAPSSFTENVDQILSSFPPPPVHEVEFTANDGETKLQIGDHGHSFSVEHYCQHPKDEASHVKHSEYSSFTVSNVPSVVDPAQVKQFVPKDMFPKVEEKLLQLAKEEPKKEVKALEDTSEPRIVELPDDEPEESTPKKASGELKPKEMKADS